MTTLRFKDGPLMGGRCEADASAMVAVPLPGICRAYFWYIISIGMVPLEIEYAFWCISERPVEGFAGP